MTRIALFVSDLPVSRAFYEALGFRVIAEWADGATIRLDENRLDLRADEAAVAGPHYFTPEIERFPRGTGVEIVLEVAQVNRVYTRARAADADIVDPLDTRADTLDTDAERPQFRLSDPDGYLLRFATAAASAGPDREEAPIGGADRGFKVVAERARSSGT